jgi:hypothetical protein
MSITTAMLKGTALYTQNLNKTDKNHISDNDICVIKTTRFLVQNIQKCGGGEKHLALSVLVTLHTHTHPQQKYATY